MGGVKPAGAMKTLSGTFGFVVSAVIAIVTVLSCQTQLSSSNRRKEKRIGDPDAVPPIYVEFKNGEGPFRTELTTLKKHGGDCQIFLLRKAGDPVTFNYCDSIPSSLKTDRIIKSAAANNARPEESIANDPNVTYRVASANQADIDAVLKTLK
jgi:hypothetical protein